MTLSIQDLLDKDIAFMGSNWIDDPSVKDGPMPGKRCNGEISCVICNDVFVWGGADCEVITEETLPEFIQAASDCSDNLELAAILYCARRCKMRPQGAMYTYIPKNLWYLFDACRPEREVGLGNPYKPGTYRSSNA
jgi:hypothetical protein